MNATRYWLSILVLLPLFMTVSCVTTVPPEALKLDKQSLEQRQIQTRVFDTEDEGKILSACAALLQDLGFNIDESETECGVLVASKQRSAKDAGQIAGMILVAALTGAAMPVDDTQKMRASIVTRPFGEDSERIAVRVTFQRIVWNTKGKICRKEGLTEPEIYQEFFSKLSKSIFLEAHEI
jgi:hypothetical protein